MAIDWMTIPAAPDSVLEFVNCQCKKGCDSRRCSCVKASFAHVMTAKIPVKNSRAVSIVTLIVIIVTMILVLERQR